MFVDSNELQMVIYRPTHIKATNLQTLDNLSACFYGVLITFTSFLYTLIARSAFNLTNGELGVYCMPIRFTVFRSETAEGAVA